MHTKGYAATSADSPLAPFAFERRTPGDRDVHVTIDFCGICHSDIHSARNEWQGTEYPFVPGHEIIGRVVKAGKDVKRLREGQRVGVGCMGLGGLGHMGVKLAASFGAEVTVFSRSPEKEADAKKLGAHDFVLTNKLGAMDALAGRYDAILDTISAKHDLSPAINALKLHGTLILVGASPENLEVSPFPLIMGNRKIVGSLVG